jgi:hypothetical protein
MNNTKILFLFFLFPSLPIFGQPTQTAGLRGLTSVVVDVGINEVDDIMSLSGVTKVGIKRDVELELRSKGVEISEKSGEHPTLYVHLDILIKEDDLGSGVKVKTYINSIRVELYDLIFIHRLIPDAFFQFSFPLPPGYNDLRKQFAFGLDKSNQSLSVVAPIWWKSTLIYVGERRLNGIKDQIIEFVKDFENDFFKENPKK